MDSYEFLGDEALDFTLWFGDTESANSSTSSSMRQSRAVLIKGVRFLFISFLVSFPPPSDGSSRLSREDFEPT